jgi:hypothetical protein
VRVHESQIFEIQSRKKNRTIDKIVKLISILELKEFCDDRFHSAHWGDVRRISILFVQMEGKFVPHFKGFKLWVIMNLNSVYIY